MSYSNSQEQIIYRDLTGQIQLGFYKEGERFPPLQEISRRYGVSYCPAQRALKALEKDGLVKLCRGKGTIVLARPYQDFLKSDLFQKRAASLADLVQSLQLFLPELCLQGICRMKGIASLFPASGQQDAARAGRTLYSLIEASLRALGSHTVLTLYYDIGAFAGSSFLDCLDSLLGKEAAQKLLWELEEPLLQFLQSGGPRRDPVAPQWREGMRQRFLGELVRYFDGIAIPEETADREPFRWEPHKGRSRYCDAIAADLICKIHQGTYPVGALLPNSAVLADIYHVSPITIRRTTGLLNQLKIAETINGVGTRVIFSGDAHTPDQLRHFMPDDHLRFFLEALQLLTITCEAVLRHSFPYFSTATRGSIRQALSLPGQKASLVMTISACLQGIVRSTPQAAVREIYEKITLQLLRGSILRLGETGREPVPGWPDLVGTLFDTVTAGDGAGFASAFSRLMEINFYATKAHLLLIGVRGVEEIADPVRIV